MKVKLFHAETMHEAIRDIKAELGPDAIILSTKRVRQGSLPFGLFGKPLLEVTAATDRDAPYFVVPPRPNPLSRRLLCRHRLRLHASSRRNESIG